MMGYEHLCEKFAYFTECNLATLEGLESRKSTSRSELKRQKEICMKMIENCKSLFKFDSPAIQGFSRLKEKLKEAGI
jgi:hypothetical protein